MPDFEKLTLYREKSTVHRFAELGDGEGEEQVMEIRSNWLTISIKLADHTYNCVVRGQNMAATLCFTGFVVDQFHRDPGMVHEAKDIDWESLWIRRLSSYESTYNPASWVSIHLDEEEVFSSGEDGKTGSFAISVYHPTPNKPTRLSYFLRLSADILEALTMTEFLHRVQNMIDVDSIISTPITPAQIATARNRKKDLMEQIAFFEAAQKVTYSPERPYFN